MVRISNITNNLKLIIGEFLIVNAKCGLLLYLLTAGEVQRLHLRAERSQSGDDVIIDLRKTSHIS